MQNMCVVRYNANSLKGGHKHMTQEQQAGPEQERPIILEIVAEDEHDVDPAAIGEVGRGILDEVKRDGYAVEPVYTGQRGGPDLLFEIFTQLHHAAQVVGTDVFAQRDVVGELANLMTIFVSVSPLAMKIFQAREKHEAKQAVITGTPPVQDQHPVKLSMVINEIPIRVEADNLKDAEAMFELAKKTALAHPNMHATPQSQVKLKVAVPKKAQRKRR